MDAMHVAKRMTADEYLALPQAEYGRPWSLVDGEVVVNDPSWLHQVIVQRFHNALYAWSIAQAGRGTVAWPVDVEVDDANVYAPDLHWYADGRAPMLHDERPYPMSDKAVEVRSDSTWRHDLGAKRAGYERAGLPELWLVDTKNHLILVFRRSSPEASQFAVAFELSADDTLTSPQLPGFELPLVTVFAEP